MTPERAAEIREAADMTPEEFAKFIGTYRGNIDRWEQGKVGLTTAVKMMYRAFGFIQKEKLWKKFIVYLVNG